MAKRSGSYVVPFSFELLSFGEAVALAADTGRISGDAGPLLETVVDMLDELGRPDEYFDCIQVAGTNGKTSTTRFSAAILRGEGLKTALYTSPQLVRYPERMEVDGCVVSDEAFSRGVSAAVEAGRRVNARRGCCRARGRHGRTLGRHECDRSRRRCHYGHWARSHTYFGRYARGHCGGEGCGH